MHFKNVMRTSTDIRIFITSTSFKFDGYVSFANFISTNTRVTATICIGLHFYTLIPLS